MEKYFSIGETAKLHNMSIETLRHYDRYNILKPDYINEKTGYRYYSTKSFIKIDLIKRCKAIGLSLEEIKETMENYDSLESVLKTLNKRKELVNKKLEELNDIKESIEKLENNIKDSLNRGINNIFIKHNDEREMIKYDYSGRYTAEFEINLRHTLIEVEKNHDNVNCYIVFETSYNDLIKEDKLTYTKTMIKLDDISNTHREIITLPKGDYLTMYFDDTIYETKKYYDILAKYIQENNINVKGDFHEMYIMTRVNNSGEIKCLAQIEIQIK
ncbi:MerR family transcriptional regulator [Romboutsia weinsteinii]|uniref:MerR family transcriptional regulator n=1 Tax=Romboutsia weinsteinii TaxID=2020949 RepID=A0A371IZ73_9FIRM|nr:MerR family transcriptional regulator [Romboutsia weinsteinii]RDY25779.1 MerR family transcriptional regulator [Romboutsia weinsteinii]